MGSFLPVGLPSVVDATHFVRGCYSLALTVELTSFIDGKKAIAMLYPPGTRGKCRVTHSHDCAWSPTIACHGLDYCV
ncbi:MAG: hypothetical protein ACPGED_05030, partial [Flavobacteriales bacterium]